MTKIIKLIKRGRKRHAPTTGRLIYDLCVVKKSSHGRFVYEKLGCFSYSENTAAVNVFRLIFWISKNVCFSGGAARTLFSLNILRQNKI